MFPKLSKTNFAYISLFLALLSSSQKVEAFGVIKRLCMTSIETQMALAGTKPPKGMKDFTCRCFIGQVKDGFSINSAKSFCREKAIDKFKL